MQKTCDRCHVSQPIEQFPKNTHCRGGHIHQCTTCRKGYYREYRRLHPVSGETERMRQWRADHLEHYRTYQREYHRRWSVANPDKLRQYRVK